MCFYYGDFALLSVVWIISLGALSGCPFIVVCVWWGTVRFCPFIAQGCKDFFTKANLSSRGVTWKPSLLDELKASRSSGLPSRGSGLPSRNSGLLQKLGHWLAISFGVLAGLRLPQHSHLNIAISQPQSLRLVLPVPEHIFLALSSNLECSHSPSEFPLISQDWWLTPL